MSDLGETWGRPTGAHPTLRRFVVVVLALLGLSAILLGGSLIKPQAATVAPPRTALVGRTTTICTVGTPTPQPSGDQQSADQPPGSTSVGAVAIRQAPDRTGSLQGSPLNSDEPLLSVTQQGKGAEVADLKASVVLQGEGVMATASTGAVFGTATTGTDSGLSAAPCLSPGTQQWFSGIVPGDADRTELILTNPDDAQAEVDLKFYGRLGRIVVPGSPAVVVEAHSSRTVSLSTLVTTEGPFSVEVQASQGRVSAVARRTRTKDLKPAGADWQLPSAGPALTALIPGVPGGDGSRELLVTNPGASRATVQVQILGLQGPYAPTGAESVEVPPESTASVDLATGLAGESGAVQLTSDLPVTGAVVSGSQRTGAVTDLAVQSAAVPLVHTGVAAFATVGSTDADLILSNGSDDDAATSFQVLNYDGVVVRTDEVLVAARSTATRRITSSPPTYLVLQVPDGSSVVGGLVLTQPEGDVAGLATLPLTSPDLASRAPRTVLDPSVGR
jgi:hypothetical protein